MICSPTARELCRETTSENKMLRRIFRLKRLEEREKREKNK
jgi:hypothetical protein